MKLWLPALALVIASARCAIGQDHLIPDASVFVDPDPYRLKARHIFAPAFAKDVQLRVLVLPSFEDEFVAGLRRKGEDVEAFVMRPSSNIWATDVLKKYESGGLQAFKPGVGKIPLEKDEAYQDLKKRTPADFRTIKPIVRARPIPREIAGELAALWKALLLGVKYPDERILGTDGVTYEFSARLKADGEVSGHIWSPEPDTKMGRVVELVDGLADYADGKIELDKLTGLLGAAKRP